MEGRARLAHFWLRKLLFPSQLSPFYLLIGQANQINPFTLPTPDGELLYAWHILPLGLYADNEAALLADTSKSDVTQTKAFALLVDDPESRLVINFHGNAGTVAQGWRTDTYKALSAGSTAKIHVLAVDYRGFGYSTGSPTEQGVITDAVATVDWALQVAKIPPERIVILGQSLGTAVTAAVAEHFISATPRVEFAGLILVAGFMNIASLLESYAMFGFVPVLSPLVPIPGLTSWITSHVVDTWDTARRIAKVVRESEHLHLSLVHAYNDYDIPWEHSDLLFRLAANATSEEGLTREQVDSAKNTLDLGRAGWINTWNADGKKHIREHIFPAGGHNRLLTFAPVALAVLKALGV
ncbi:MAG: hypothetical protein M1833_001504 [Piccolia ochrophora]|nr:MAG: hypothetical protein M1833_001504 [Piccolia ochrophora]